MNLGTGIFLSALFLGVIALFISTKDRWNWKKIVGRTLLGTVALVTLLAGGAYVYFHFADRPEPLAAQTEFWGVSIDATKGDVKFKKGEPSRVFGKPDREIWLYEPEGAASTKKADSDVVPWGSYIVSFRGDRIRLVSYVGYESLGSPELFGIRTSSPM